MLHALLSDESGATMVEYALMLSLIALVAFGAVQAVGNSTLAFFEEFARSMP